MQRCERVMYEAGERVKLWRLTGDEVTFDVGSKSMHRPLTASSCKYEARRHICTFVSMSSGVVSAADERLDGTGSSIHAERAGRTAGRCQNWAASVDRSNAAITSVTRSNWFAASAFSKCLGNAGKASMRRTPGSSRAVRSIARGLKYPAGITKSATWQTPAPSDTRNTIAIDILLETLL
jgi:hypothetical protein